MQKATHYLVRISVALLEDLEWQGMTPSKEVQQKQVAWWQSGYKPEIDGDIIPSPADSEFGFS